MQDTSEIAAAVQQGQVDILKLWWAVRRFAMKQANRWHKALGERGGQTTDDLEQTAFIALLEALDGWEADKGSFIGWYALRLKTAFAKVYGLRTERDKRDPLNNFPLAIDTPLNEDSDLTIADVLPDPLAEKPFEAMPLEIAIQDALAALPPEEQSAIVNEFWREQRADSKTRSAALRRLRYPSVSRNLREFL